MGERRPIELEEGWSRMLAGIAKLKRILAGDTPGEQFTPTEYINLYTTCYNMCTQKPPHDFSQQLYTRYGETFSTNISEVVNPSLASHQNEFLLRELHKHWANHKIMVRWLSRFFNYLDRYYIIRHQLKSLGDVGLIRFRDEVYERIKGKAREALLDCIAKERSGEHAERTLLSNVLAIFQEVGMGTLELYEEDFERPLIAATKAWYSRQAASWIETDSCPVFLVKAETALAAEEDRVQAYLHASSRRKLLGAVETELLATYETRLLEKEDGGCAALLRDNQTEDLARMFRLFSREGIPQGLDPLSLAFKRHIAAEGARFNKEASEAVAARKEAAAGAGSKPSKDKAQDAGLSQEMQYIRHLIDLHDKYQEYVRTCFQDSSIFHKALKEAFEGCCNSTMAGMSCSELLSGFANEMLVKGGGEKLGEAEVEALLEKVVALLAYVQDKDMFSEFYRKKLSNRLLKERTVGLDQERALIARFKEQNGQQFTSKMEGMVTDVQLVGERQAQFEEYCRGRGDGEGPPSIVVTVLTTGLWPSFKPVKVQMPPEMLKDVVRFQDFYAKFQTNRKLTWYHSMGSCLLKVHFDARPVELQLANALQAAVLLTFSETERLTYGEISAELGQEMGDEDLKKILASLACGKYKILLKEPPGKTVEKGDAFTFNRGFTDKMRRIKLGLPQSGEDRKKTEDTVLADRVPLMDATVVRIMKARKRLPHNELSMMVMDQLKGTFHPDAKFVKKCIERLIDREYLQRNANDSTTYEYLA